MHPVADEHIRIAERQAQASIRQAAMLEAFGRTLQQFSKDTTSFGNVIETCGRAALKHGNDSYQSAIAAHRTGSLREFHTATQAHQSELEAAMDAVRVYSEVRDYAPNDSKCLADDRA